MSKSSSKRKKQQKNNQNLLIGLGAVVVIIIVAAVALANPSAPTANQTTVLPLEISVQEAYNLREQGTMILDVRTPAEWVEGHVPGATLIPLDELPNRLAELPQDEDIVVICRSGNRSATARDILLNAGFSSVTSVAGGFNNWVANGYDVATGQ
jgi:rhodanese-related sulfurtransferase